jgi:hypothetical protein
VEVGFNIFAVTPHAYQQKQISIAYQLCGRSCIDELYITFWHLIGTREKTEVINIPTASVV